MPEYHARVAFHSTSSGPVDEIVTVLHVDCAVLTDPPNWTSIASDIEGWLGPVYLAMLSVNDTLQDVTVTDENYPGSTHGQGVKVVGTIGNRTATGVALSPALCAVISYKTAQAKRYARGHSFAPPVWNANELTSAGHFVTTGPYFAACQSFATTFAAGKTVGSTQYIPGIFSRRQVAQNLSPFFFPLVAAQVRTTQHWLRSRTA